MRTLEQIAEDLFQARLDERKANEQRVKLEEELIALVGAKDEGSQTHTIGDYKVIVEGKLIRKIDWDKFDKLVASKIPVSLHPIKVVREEDVAGIKYLALNEPAMYSILAKALTVKPAKTSVRISLGA